MATFKPSPFQEDIYDFIVNGTGNAVIDAVAGSGKTTTIVEALSKIPTTQKIIFVAFNKAIVNELSERVPKNVEVRTMHSFGYGVVRSNFGNVMMKDDKSMSVIKMLYPSWDIPEEAEDGYMIRVRRLVELARLNLVTNMDGLYDIAHHHDVELYNSEVENAWHVFNIVKKNRKVIDMTDMIFMPAHYNLNCRKYDWVFVDEAQDLNKAQQALLRNMVKPNTGRFIAVGDPRQAIYGFAGADAESFKALQAVPNTTSLPLSVNYRCGKKIIELAQTIVPQITAHDNATEGQIIEEGKWKDIVDGDYVLCRNVKPLVKLCLELLVDGKKAAVRGRDLGQNLANMLKRTKQTKFEFAMDRIFKDIEFQIQKQIRRGAEEEDVRNSNATKTAFDKAQAIEVIGGSSETVEEVVKKIQSLFTDDKEGIILSTIHKAKGLESKTVHILNAELMPSPWARQEWEHEQEQNLEYVAYTRAKETLSFIVDYDGTK